MSTASITGVARRRLSAEGPLDARLDPALDTVRTGGAGGVAGAVGSVR
jgi:hypothetical protein